MCSLRTPRSICQSTYRSMLDLYVGGDVGRHIGRRMSSLRAPTAEELWVLFNCITSPDLCLGWSSVEGIAGKGNELYNYHA